MKRVSAARRKAAIKEAVAAVMKSKKLCIIRAKVPEIIYNRFKLQVQKTAMEYGLTAEQAEAAVTGATLITLFRP